MLRKIAFWSLFTLLSTTAALARPFQDCNLDGQDDSMETAWQDVAVDDPVTYAAGSPIEVLANDALAGGYYGGRCVSGFCENCAAGSTCTRDTVVKVTGPQHGSASVLGGGGIDHAKFDFSFSDSSTYCGHTEYIVYYWQDQCSMQSHHAVVRVSVPCPGSQPNRVLRLGGSGWILVKDQGPGSSLDLDGPFTLEFWVKPASTNGYGTLISKWGDDQIDDRSYMVRVTAGGSIEFSVSRTDNQQDLDYQHFTAGSLLADDWQHVACTYDGSTRKIYVNGVLAGTKDTVGPIHSTGDTDVAIGARLANDTALPSQVTERFNGSMDRVRIWKRALRQDEIELAASIRFLPNAGSPNQLQPPECAWEFELDNADDSFGHADGEAKDGALFPIRPDPPELDFDCDGNGLPDYYDIYAGHLFGQVDVDVNNNGVLDSCEITPFCFGDGSQGPCPCNNNGSVGHGCENSSSTGGAILTWSGNPSLSADTVILTSSGERPNSLSIFLQGSQSVSPLIFGDGLRCADGILKRLYSRVASGGVVVAPQGADPTISARSAAVGQTIPAYTVRSYQVYYRDANQAFCPDPPGSTFNASNGLKIPWRP